MSPFVVANFTWKWSGAEFGPRGTADFPGKSGVAGAGAAAAGAVRIFGGGGGGSICPQPASNSTNHPQRLPKHPDMIPSSLVNATTEKRATMMACDEKNLKSAARSTSPAGRLLTRFPANGRPPEERRPRSGSRQGRPASGG